MPDVAWKDIPRTTTGCMAAHASKTKMGGKLVSVFWGCEAHLPQLQLIDCRKAAARYVDYVVNLYKRLHLQEREVCCVDAAARSLAAGSAVCGAAVEGDARQRRTQQVRSV